MRKLASIRVIHDLKPIDGADKIELATIDGWQVVVKKGEFQLASRCVYFEIDSLLPERPEFEFLRKCCYVDEKKSKNGSGFRVKLTRMRGHVSQGLALPLDVFGEEFNEKYIVAPVGTDVTEVLGVKKFEEILPAHLSGIARGAFPSFVRKTDLERIQNYYGDLKSSGSYKDFWEGTIKMDGASMTVYWNDGDFGVCSRNINLKETDENTYWNVARDLKLREKLSKIGRNVALQGELVGPGIQKNVWGFPCHEFLLFDIWLIDEQRYMNPIERYAFFTYDLEDELMHVPIYGFTTFENPEDGECWDINMFMYLADRLSDGMTTFGLTKKHIRSPIVDTPTAEGPYHRFEGLVWKNAVDPFKRFKVISNSYLFAIED